MYILKIKQILIYLDVSGLGIKDLLVKAVIYPALNEH